MHHREGLRSVIKHLCPRALGTHPGSLGLVASDLKLEPIIHRGHHPPEKSRSSSAQALDSSSTITMNCRSSRVGLTALTLLDPDPLCHSGIRETLQSPHSHQSVGSYQQAVCQDCKQEDNGCQALGTFSLPQAPYHLGCTAALSPPATAITDLPTQVCCHITSALASPPHL